MFSDFARVRIISDLYRFSFAEVVSATVGSSLLHLFFKFSNKAAGEEQLQSRAKRIATSIVSYMEGILATLRPFRRNSEFLANADGVAPRVAHREAGRTALA